MKSNSVAIVLGVLFFDSAPRPSRNRSLPWCPPRSIQLWLRKTLATRFRSAPTMRFAGPSLTVLQLTSVFLQAQYQQPWPLCRKLSGQARSRFYQIALPTGYRYKMSTIRTISVTPEEGDRASVMGVSSNKEGVGVYSLDPPPRHWGWSELGGSGHHRIWSAGRRS